MNEQGFACPEFDQWRSTSRRRLIAAGLGAGVQFFDHARSALAQATFRAGHEGNVLVVVFLRGGADVLNIVAPYGEDAYYRARPTLALPSPVKRVTGRLIDLDGFFGLHPAMASLHPLYETGSACWIHACGSGDSTRSHFEAMSTMERGQADGVRGTASGWLARHIASTPARSGPMRSVAIGGTMPDSLAGAINAVAVQNLGEYRLASTDEGYHDVLAQLYSGNDEIAQSGNRALNALKILRESDPRQYKPEFGAAYGTGGIAQALKDVAYLVKHDVGLETACLESVGWDTHVAQGAATGWQASLLGELSDAISSFFRDLGPTSQRVTLVVQTEFGRRLEENSGFGTDHGHGGAMLVVGGGVRGGKVYGKWPGLVTDSLVGPGDLAVTTDYRNVLADLLEARLDSPSVDKVFPGLKRERTGIVQTLTGDLANKRSAI
ncbi:MAG: DUF1501 domain-containing protein [Armatimonadetes bacterium]|nr:DUF1501 domain-containing protein [Armatimonadota bacterium]